MERSRPSRPAPAPAVTHVSIHQIKAATLLAMPERELLAYVRTTRRANVVKIYRLGLVCHCHWVDGLGYGKRKASCGDDGVPVPGFIPCDHIGKPTLPLSVCAVVLERIFGAEYREPPLSREISQSIARADRVETMRLRAMTGCALWHPADAKQPDRLGTLAVSSPNGKVSDGATVTLADLEGDDYSDPGVMNKKPGRMSEKPEYKLGPGCMDVADGDEDDYEV